MPDLIQYIENFIYNLCLSSYQKRMISNITKRMVNPIHNKGTDLISYEVAKSWYYIKPFLKYVYRNKKVIKDNKLSLEEYGLFCLKKYYSQDIFQQYIGLGQLIYNKFSFLSIDPNISSSIFYRKELSADLDLINKHYHQSQLKPAYIYTRPEISTMQKLSNELDDDLINLNVVLNKLNLIKYDINLCWNILYHLGISIMLYNNNLYFLKKEIDEVINQVRELESKYTPLQVVDKLLHNSTSHVQLSNIIYSAPPVFYYLMSEKNRGFYFIEKVDMCTFDQIYNDYINCKYFLTQAEITNDLSSLNKQIPDTLASQILNISRKYLYWLDEEYGLFNTTTKDYCNRNATIELLKLQKIYEEKYVIHEDIIGFLNLNIKALSETDIELLNTCDSFTIPDYIHLMDTNRGLNLSKAYLKEDVLKIRYYFHKNLRNIPTLKVDNNFIGETPYYTYIGRLHQYELYDRLKEISETSCEIWDSYAIYKLKTKEGAKQIQTLLSIG